MKEIITFLKFPNIFTKFKSFSNNDPASKVCQQHKGSFIWQNFPKN